MFWDPLAPLVHQEPLAHKGLWAVWASQAVPAWCQAPLVKLDHLVMWVIWATLAVKVFWDSQAAWGLWAVLVLDSQAAWATLAVKVIWASQAVQVLGSQAVQVLGSQAVQVMVSQAVVDSQAVWELDSLAAQV